MIRVELSNQLPVSSLPKKRKQRRKSLEQGWLHFTLEEIRLQRYKEEIGLDSTLIVERTNPELCPSGPEQLSQEAKRKRKACLKEKSRRKHHDPTQSKRRLIERFENISLQSENSQQQTHQTNIENDSKDIEMAEVEEDPKYEFADYQPESL